MERTLYDGILVILGRRRRGFLDVRAREHEM
jgi:hypothetical protein